MKKRLLSICAAIVLGLVPTLACAAPANDTAMAHITAIAIDDVDAIIASYMPESEIEWIGGPLDGTHRGVALIKALWTKYNGIHGSQKVLIEDMAEYLNPNGSTVNANLVFTDAKGETRVHLVQVYRAVKLIREIWQIVPPPKDGSQPKS